MMRVLYVNHTLQPSGAGISLGTLVRHLGDGVEKFFLLKAGCGVADLLGAAPDRCARERFMPQFMTTRYVPQLPLHLWWWQIAKMPWTVLRLAQLRARWKIDLVHANETTLVTYILAARLLGLPAVMHARTAIAGDRSCERLLLARAGALARVCIVCIDEEVKRSLPEKARRNAEVVYNPIQLGAAPAPEAIRAKRASWGIAEGDLVMGQVASLHAQKGIWLILDLAEKLAGEFPRLRIVLVGDRSAEAGEGPALAAAIRERALEERVILPGYDADLATVYGSLDVALCLFGGALGGVGRAAYEAALAEKPLIATMPDPEDSETLRHGVSALLYRPDDEAGIAEGMRELARDADRRKALGASAKKSIAWRHDPETIAAQVRKIYERLSARGVSQKAGSAGAVINV